MKHTKLMYHIVNLGTETNVLNNISIIELVVSLSVMIWNWKRMKKANFGKVKETPTRKLEYRTDKIHFYQLRLITKWKTYESYMERRGRYN